MDSGMAGAAVEAGLPLLVAVEAPAHLEVEVGPGRGCRMFCYITVALNTFESATGHMLAVRELCVLGNGVYSLPENLGLSLDMVENLG